MLDAVRSFFYGSALMLFAVSSTAAPAAHQVTHVFSVDDVQGGFNGSTYGAGGLVQDPSILCGLSSTCPAGAEQPFVDKSGDTLYPIDSEFGFYVTDFVGAAQKQMDGDYAEGFAGNVFELGVVAGVRLSNAPTDTFKARPPMGTWCVGLGATSVKCSTEHYTVLEHATSCHETIPYAYADTVSGQQADLIDPETGAVVGTCDEGRLDNEAFIVSGGMVTTDRLVDSTPGVQMEANESTVRDDIAVSADYSITLKDDGKPLYRWGSLVKRPNDVRLYARIPLPALWKANPTLAYPVSHAELTVTHLITNNPNDQIRPEDMENEAATGRLPEYVESLDGLIRVALRDCYEGDGDFIPAGTVLRNAPFALDATDTDPYAFSSDLLGALTNAWYTTTNRDPFELDPVSGIGPRWRLKANKFGQDIPGLEIPAIECSPVPFQKDNIKYATGEPTTTTINLLDWAPGNSPLATSQGWIDPDGNGANEVPLSGLSVNGLPITPDFDLGVYVKGDSKSTVVYDAALTIIYDTVPVPVP